MKIIISILLLSILIFNCSSKTSEINSQLNRNKPNITENNYCDIKALTGRSDTVLNADLNVDGSEETIKLSIIWQRDKSGSWISGYSLTIDDSKIQKTLDIAALMIVIKLVDIDKYDKFREIVVAVNTDPEGMEYYIHKFDKGNIYEIGPILNFFFEDPETFPGNGKIYANNWMGFWKIYETYTYNSDKNTLIGDNTTGIYDVNFPKGIKVDITVTQPFKLHKDKDDNAEFTASLNKGMKINILKAYITAKCKDAIDNDFSLCHWYYIESDSGNGWVRLKDFKDNVEGLPWAG